MLPIHYFAGFCKERNGLAVTSVPEFHQWRNLTTDYQALILRGSYCCPSQVWAKSDSIFHDRQNYARGEQVVWIKSRLFSLLFPKNLAPRTEIVPVPGPGHHLIHDVSKSRILDTHRMWTHGKIAFSISLWWLNSFCSDSSLWILILALSRAGQARSGQDAKLAVAITAPRVPPPSPNLTSAPCSYISVLPLQNEHFPETAPLFHCWDYFFSCLFFLQKIYLTYFSSHLPSSFFYLLSSLPVCLQREVSRPISRWIQYWKIGKFNIKKLFEAAEWYVLPPEMEESKEALGNAAWANQACGEPEGPLRWISAQAS